MTKKSLVYPYAIWVIIFTVIPLLLIIYYSLHITVDGEAVFSLENFKRIFSASDNLSGQGAESVYIFLNVIWRSIRLAFKCTLICLVLGYPVGYILASKEFETRNTIIFLFLIPMWMNVLLRTYAWLTILENNGILNSILNFFGLPNQTLLYTEGAVVLGMVYNFIPFMILPIYTILKKINVNLIEAAQDLGADGRKTFFKILFPLSLPGVISGVTMVFMPAVTTFVISNLLGGGQFILIGNLIEQQFLRAGNWGFGSAIATVLMVIILISIGIFSLVDKDSENQGGTLY
jgi:spermidine/putrescine transport system permease protein